MAVGEQVKGFRAGQRVVAANFAPVWSAITASAG